MASEEEKELYREQQACAREAAEKSEIAKRVQIAIVSDRDLRHEIAAKSDLPAKKGK